MEEYDVIIYSLEEKILNRNREIGGKFHGKESKTNDDTYVGGIHPYVLKCSVIIIAQPAGNIVWQ